MANRIASIRCKNRCITIEYPDAKGQESTIFYGYTVYSNGDIYSPLGKKLQRLSISDSKSHVHMSILGNKLRLNIARLIYNLFSGELLTTKDFILFKDGNSQNKDISNLCKIGRTEFKNSYVNRKSTKKFSDQEAEAIRKRYIEATDNLTNIKRGVNAKISYRSLATEYGCSICLIQQIVKGVY